MPKKEYRNPYWFEFREEAFNRLGCRCSRCFRDDTEVTLQVHHKTYYQGRKIWEYDFHDCEILCKGCHARLHGQIRPDSEWTLSHTVDLDDLTGTCELCSNSIRYEHHLIHNNWHEPLVVGTNCCDNLTDDPEVVLIRRKLESYNRFIKSDKFVEYTDGSISYVKNKFFTFEVKKIDEIYVTSVNGKRVATIHSIKHEAVFAMFELVKYTPNLYTYFDQKGNYIRKTNHKN